MATLASVAEPESNAVAHESLSHFENESFAL